MSMFSAPKQQAQAPIYLYNPYAPGGPTLLPYTPGQGSPSPPGQASPSQGYSPGPQQKQGGGSWFDAISSALGNTGGMAAGMDGGGGPQEPSGPAPSSPNAHPSSFGWGGWDADAAKIGGYAGMGLGPGGSFLGKGAGGLIGGRGKGITYGPTERPAPQDPGTGTVTGADQDRDRADRDRADREAQERGDRDYGT